jgi:2-keto-4-pentenoate hydratase/2-oxohepta-3-ene-1,7-dioic acid hydratase in catechol pathway
LLGGKPKTQADVAGTQGGIGLKRRPTLFLKPGDVVEMEVDRIGTLINNVEDEVQL